MPEVHSSGGSKRHFLRNQQKRFAREHFAFAREQKRFPRCRRSGVVFPRSVHPPSDPGVAKRDRPPAVSLQKEQLFKKFSGKMYFPTPLACLMGRGVFFQFRWATDWLQSRCRSCPPDTHYVCVRPRRGREQGGPSCKQDRRTAS